MKSCDVGIQIFDFVCCVWPGLMLFLPMQQHRYCWPPSSWLKWIKFDFWSCTMVFWLFWMILWSWLQLRLQSTMVSLSHSMDLTCSYQLLQLWVVWHLMPGPGTYRLRLHMKEHGRTCNQMVNYRHRGLMIAVVLSGILWSLSLAWGGIGRRPNRPHWKDHQVNSWIVCLKGQPVSSALAWTFMCWITLKIFLANKRHHQEEGGLL